MKQVWFLLEEELKKVFRGKYIYVFIVVFILDIISFVSEYIDRVRSTLYGTGVHVSGQGMEYLVNHEFGNFGVLVLYLLPLLLIASPVFADEVTSKMLSQIRVTKNGRKSDAIVKSVMILVIQIIWIIIFSIFSVILAFTLFDVSILNVIGYISEIQKCIINIALGCFCMANGFFVISYRMKNTVNAMAVGFATIVMPMFIEVDILWTHFFPIIGMQAECLQKRSETENLMVWIFYVCAGIFLFVSNLIKINKT